MQKSHICVILRFIYLYISQKNTNFALVIELERHIEILLLSNDCVIVPELGGFMTHHIEAHYDEDDQLFLPPLRTLGFNPQLKMNDSLLVQSYVEAYDISYPEALRRVEHEVESLKEQLSNEGTYELHDIGTLSINPEGHYVFTPCEAGILTPELYGLSTVDIKPLSLAHEVIPTEPASRFAATGRQTTAQLQPVKMETEEEVLKEPEVQEEQEAQVMPIVAETTAEEETVNTSQETPSEEPSGTEARPTASITWLRRIAVAAAIILALFLVTIPLGQGGTFNQAVSHIANPLFWGFTSKDTSMEKISISKKPIRKKVVVRKVVVAKPTTVAKTDTIVKTDTAAIAVAKSDTVTAVKAKEGKYCIVMASYITKQNARDYVEKLHKEGLSEAAVHVRKNVTRIVYGSFPTEREAQEKLRAVRGKPHFEEAWVMEI